MACQEGEGTGFFAEGIEGQLKKDETEPERGQAQRFKQEGREIGTDLPHPVFYGQIAHLGGTEGGIGRVMRKKGQENQDPHGPQAQPQDFIIKRFLRSVFFRP